MLGLYNQANKNHLFYVKNFSTLYILQWVCYIHGTLHTWSSFPQGMVNNGFFHFPRVHEDIPPSYHHHHIALSLLLGVRN